MGFTWKGLGRALGIKGKPLDDARRELGRNLGYKGRPEEWGRRLAFDLATGTVSVKELKASVGTVARFWAMDELYRLRDQVDEAIAAMKEAK